MLRIQIIIYGIMAFMLWAGFTVIRQQSKKIDALSTNIEGMQNLYSDEVEYYKNKLDRQTARFDASLLNISQLRAMRENDRLAFINQFEGVKRNLKNLHSAYSTLTQAVGTIETNLYDTTIVNVDSTITMARKFYHKEEYLEARGVVYDSTLTMDYSVLVPLEGVVYWQRQHWKLFGERRRWLPRFWGSKKYITEITSPNPNVTIKGGEYVQVQKK